MALTKNENIQGTSNQCAMLDEVFRAIGKTWTIMDQINKTDINEISISYVTKKINLISQWVVFLSRKIYFTDIHIKVFLGCDYFVENE